MVSRFPELSSALGVSPLTFGDGQQHLLSRAVHHFGQWFCALRGHDQLLELQHDRIFLRCASCGVETPGWRLTGKPRRVGDSRLESVACTSAIGNLNGPVRCSTH